MVALIIKGSTFLFDKHGKILHFFSALWAYQYLFIIPLLKVSIEKRVKLSKKDAVLFIANHSSQMDISLCYRLFYHFKFVSKIENFMIPFIGWNMYLNNYIYIKKTKIRSIIEMINSIKKNIKEGNSVLIFPEGTRSTNGEIQSFKLSVFKISKENDIKIVPVVFSGANKLLKKKSALINFAPLNIKGVVMESTQAKDGESVDKYCERVRNLMIEEKLKLES